MPLLYTPANISSICQIVDLLSYVQYFILI